jgi:recombination protein RecR
VSRAEFPEPIKDLVLCLKQLPGVGPRSAERVALWLHREGPVFSEALAESLTKVQSQVSNCGVCGFFATPDGCQVCQDAMREPDTLCIVEHAVDVLALEKTGAFRGQYQVLGGRLSPLQHVGPDDLPLDHLQSRLRDGAFREVILALSNDVEGEATANYLVEMFEGMNLSVTRLAQGLPAGGGLGHADELTLLRALSGRTKVGS